MSSFMESLQIGAHLATIGGIALAVFGFLLSIHTYLNERRKDRLDRELGTFNDLDDKYVEFMYECARHPDLDLGSVPLPATRQMTPEQERAERALFAVLFSIFERAYVMFERRSDKQMKELQFDGWKRCMRMYCARPSFRAEWALIGTQFDREFNQFMQRTIDNELGRSGSDERNSEPEK